MKLHEYQAKRIFARYGVPIPKGEVATEPYEAREIAQRLGTRVVVKSQVLVGGRGKAGGIQVVDTPDGTEIAAERILGLEIKGLPVRLVLVDEAADIQEEIYLGMTIDRERRRVVMMASEAGGVDIEEIAQETPEKIVTLAINPFLGLMDFQARELMINIGLSRQHIVSFVRIARGLYRAFVESDASLAEINPLVVTGEGTLLAVDGKMVLDDNALFKHPDLAEMRDLDEEDPTETEARRHDLSYVRLDGRIGCMVNGAGLAMATMDIIKLNGGEPANFLDIGGGAQAEKVTAALRIILSDPQVKAVLINIFGGITRCDDVAWGIVSALGDAPMKVPMVVRLVGTNEVEGRQILAEANMMTAETLLEAAQKAVAAANGTAVAV